MAPHAVGIAIATQSRRAYQARQFLSFAYRRAAPLPARNDPKVYARRLRAVLISSIPLLEARGIVIVLMAGMVGVIAGALVTGMSALVQGMHY
ncbi:hypothetical protein EN834_35455, partial [bacterium M00.F.Ca.ET.191.01.1.1]